MCRKCSKFQVHTCVGKAFCPGLAADHVSSVVQLYQEGRATVPGIASGDNTPITSMFVAAKRRLWFPSE